MPRELTDYNFTSSHRPALNYEELFNGRIWRLEHGVDFMGTPRFCAGRVRKAARARRLNVRIDVGATFVVLRVVGTMNATRVQPQTQQHQVTEPQQITRNTDFDVTPEMRLAAAPNTFHVWRSDDVDLLVINSEPLAIPLRQNEAAELRALRPFTNPGGRQLVFERVTQFTRHLRVNDGWRVIHLSDGCYSHRSGENVSITEQQAAYMVASLQLMRLHGEQQSTPREPVIDTTPQSDVVVDDSPTPLSNADVVDRAVQIEPAQSTVTRRTSTSTTTTSTPTTSTPTTTSPPVRIDELERRRRLLQRGRQPAEPQPQTTTTSTTTTSPEAADAPAEEASSESCPAFAAAVHALRQYTNREHRPANALLQAGQRWVWDSRLNRWCVRAQRRGPSGS